MLLKLVPLILAAILKFDNAKVKLEISYAFLAIDARNYKSNGDTILGEKMDNWIDFFFKNDRLLKYFRDGLEDSSVKNELHDLINTFYDRKNWSSDWPSSQELRIMGQILEFIDENFKEELQSISSPHYPDYPVLPFDISMIFGLFSSRSKALSELEDVHEYLQNKFPLPEIQNEKKPISNLEELNLIEHLVENSPLQKLYSQHLENSFWLDKKQCIDERLDKIKKIKEMIQGKKNKIFRKKLRN
jgi:hypothetical protein